MFPITPQWRAFLVLDELADDEWLYLAHYPGEYDADGRERAELIRVNRADLHYESFGWLSVSETLTPMPDGDWLITNVSFSTTGFYRLRRDGQGRELIFRFDEPTMNIVTNPTVLFSPDGQWMYFNVDNSSLAQLGVYGVRLDGTELTNLTPNIEHFLILLDWPPTPEWVFVERGARDRHIYMLGVGGSDFGPLVSNLDLSDETWVATMGSLMILRNRQTGELSAVHPRSLDPVWQIHEFVQSVKQLPSGELLIATTLGIARLNSDGTSHPIAPFTNHGLLYFLPPSGDWVYYFGNGVDGNYTESIGRLNVRTGHIQNIVRGMAGLDLIEFAPDGTWLVFKGIVDSKPGLYRVHTDGSGLYRITDNYADPSFVDFGPPLDMDWSAGLLLAGGALLLIVGAGRAGNRT